MYIDQPKVLRSKHYCSFIISDVSQRKFETSLVRVNQKNSVFLKLHLFLSLFVALQSVLRSSSRISNNLKIVLKKHSKNVNLSLVWDSHVHL